MAHTENYGNHTIEVRDRPDGSEELRINNQVIDVRPDPSMPGMLRSRYAFSPAPTLLDLGRLVVDAQLALETPQLESMKPDWEEPQ